VSDKTLAELGESESLRRTIGRLTTSESVLIGPGDDAAVINLSENRFVVTTDSMIEDHDFKLNWSSGFDLGYKAVATNLADVAAMGAKPVALVVSLAVPKQTRISWLEAFADGLSQALTELAPTASVVGGDLASSEKVFISVTAHGDLEGREPVLRSGAKVGDLLAVGGTLGKAAAGLALLTEGGSAAEAFDDLVSFQLRPRPPIELGVLAANYGATAMLDISDSLVKDAARIAEQSKVCLSINSSDLLGFQAVLEQAAQRLNQPALDWVLFGGEDHGLLATFPSLELVPKGFKAIGKVIAKKDHFVELDDQAIDPRGWDSVTG
jgi:thiamine-monophosphate kinase